MTTTSVKRILSVILCVVVFVACVPVSTFGADGVTWQRTAVTVCMKMVFVLLIHPI